MVVYWEYAFAENFLLDGLLLYLALRAVRAKVHVLNLLFAAAAGAAEAVVFPLIPLPVWSAYLVKVLGGALIVVIALRKERLKTYILAGVVFFLFTFALGGLLTAAYSFFGVEYTEGAGYVVEHAPVALVVALAGIFVVALCAGCRFFYRYQKVQKNLFCCRIPNGGRVLKWKGFADSGNCLTFRGRPVCVISATAALALKEPRALGRMEVNTVNGAREVPVLALEEMTVFCGKRQKTFRDVPLAVAGDANKDYQLILHTALTEGIHEDIKRVKVVAAKDNVE